MAAKEYEKKYNKLIDKSPIENELVSYAPAPVEAFADLVKLYEVLTARRRIIDDSDYFKSFAMNNDEQKRMKFKRFRAEYPVRREFL